MELLSAFDSSIMSQSRGPVPLQQIVTMDTAVDMGGTAGLLQDEQEAKQATEEFTQQFALRPSSSPSQERCPPHRDIRAIPISPQSSPLLLQCCHHPPLTHCQGMLAVCIAVAVAVMLAAIVVVQTFQTRIPLVCLP